MFLQTDNSDNYDSVQRLSTRVAILRVRLNMMRMDHPEREALLTEFATLQAQLTLARTNMQRFRLLGSTF